MSTLLYFAYGSNLNHEIMKKRCPDSEPLFRALLENWQLVFESNGGLGYCNIKPKDAEKVVGGLWKISQTDLSLLDFFEGYPKKYDRVTLTVKDEKGSTHQAIVYKMTDESYPMYPIPHYIDTVNKGYMDFNIQKKI